MNPIRIEVPKELFTPAESKHYEEDAEVGFLKKGFDIYEFKSPVHWQADITNTGGALLVVGTVEGEATGTCARCLEEAVFPISGEIEGYFLINGEEAPDEDLEDDEFEFLPDDKVINMAPLIESAILLEIPPMVLCNDDCAGLCPTCGANLNESDCGCDNAGQDGQVTLGTNNPFAALKDYDFGN